MRKMYCALSDESAVRDTIVLLRSAYGAPRVGQRLNIFSVDGQGREADLSIQEGRIVFKLREAGGKRHYSELKNKNIKAFFRILDSLGFNRASVGVAGVVAFDAGDCVLSVLEPTFVGALLEISSNAERVPDHVARFLAEAGLETLGSAKMKRLNAKILTEQIPFFDGNGVLHRKIKEFAHGNDLDVRADSQTLSARLEAMSNDYSSVEVLYEKAVGLPLLGSNESLCDFGVKPVSIVVPCYNSESSILFTLRSIQAQNISADERRLIQVILVDDGSMTPVSRVVSESGMEFDFELAIVRLETNADLANARNVGASMADHDHLLFIDSDIVLSSGYVREHSYRVQVIANAIFTSFRTNIKLDSPILDDAQFERGIPSDLSLSDDSRLRSVSKMEQAGWSPYQKAERRLEILDDSDYFKHLSFGSKVGVYDLPGIASGHNVSVRRETMQKAGGFSKEFKGWGLEDKYFAARVVANGNFIIPVPSVSVYHIGYGPRDGDLTRKKDELDKNHETYCRLLEEDWTV